jgi:hypothetical protein
VSMIQYSTCQMRWSPLCLASPDQEGVKIRRWGEKNPRQGSLGSCNSSQLLLKAVQSNIGSGPVFNPPPVDLAPPPRGKRVSNSTPGTIAEKVVA